MGSCQLARPRSLALSQTCVPNRALLGGHRTRRQEQLLRVDISAMNAQHAYTHNATQHTRPRALFVQSPIQAAAPKRFYLPQLDGLRFSAFFLVFLHHSPVFPGGSRVANFVQQLGWIGVDLFLVLSAYLLIALLRKEYVATGAVDFKRFYIRRVLRIWPLFYLYVGLCFLYFATLDGHDMTAVAGRTVGHLFFVDNFFTAVSDGYNPLSFTPHLWTIAFEEQMYLVMPLLFMAILAVRENTKLVLLTALTVIASQPLLRWALGSFSTQEHAVWVLPFLHFDSIFAGVLLGAGVGSRLRTTISGDLLIAAGVALFGIMLFAPGGTDYSAFMPNRNVMVLTFVASAFFLIVLGCLDETSSVSRFLARQPLVFLGRISYGLYVWHWVATRVVEETPAAWLSARFHSTNPYVAWFVTVLPALALTVLLSVFSYLALERPFLRLKGRFTIVPNRTD